MTSTPGPRHPDRSILRGAALADAARVAGADDVLIVRVDRERRLALVEGVICGEHWQGPLALDVAGEPLLRQALVGDTPVRCDGAARRRVCGPFWASGAVLVPHHRGPESTIVVLAGYESPPSDGAARYAAAAVRAFFPAPDPARPRTRARRRSDRATAVTDHRDDLTGLLDLGGWEDAIRRRATADEGLHGVLVIDVARETAEDEPVADPPLRRVAATVRASARGVDVVARIGPSELCVLMREGHPPICSEVAARVRAQLLDPGDDLRVSMGWGIAPRAGAIPRALEVARAMAAQDRRARADRPRP